MEVIGMIIGLAILIGIIGSQQVEQRDREKRKGNRPFKGDKRLHPYQESFLKKMKGKITIGVAKGIGKAGGHTPPMKDH